MLDSAITRASTPAHGCQKLRTKQLRTANPLAVVSFLVLRRCRARSEERGGPPIALVHHVTASDIQSAVGVVDQAQGRQTPARAGSRVERGAVAALGSEHHGAVVESGRP